MFRTQIGGVFGFIDPRLAAGLRDLRDTTTELIGVTGIRGIHDARPILPHLIRFAVTDRSRVHQRDFGMVELIVVPLNSDYSWRFGISRNLRQGLKLLPDLAERIGGGCALDR